MKHQIHRWTTRVSVCLGIAILAGCSSIPWQTATSLAPSVSGDWIVTVGSDQATTMSLVEDKGTITGNYQMGLVKTPVTGKRQDSKLDLTVTSSFSGLTATSSIHADVSQDGRSLTGTIRSDTIVLSMDGNSVQPATGSEVFKAAKKAS